MSPDMMSIMDESETTEVFDLTLNVQEDTEESSETAADGSDPAEEELSAGEEESTPEFSNEMIDESFSETETVNTIGEAPAADDVLAEAEGIEIVQAE